MRSSLSVQLDSALLRPPSAARTAFLRDQPYAHRGLWGGVVVENSLAAARTAIAAGHGIECDVQAAKDGTPFVFHDHDLDRLTLERGPVGARNAAALDRILLGASGEHILRLTALLELVAGQVPILIEMKSPGRQIVPLCLGVRRALEGYRGKAAIMSFDPRIPRWFGEHAPHIVRGLVLSHGLRSGARGVAERRIALLAARAEFLALDVRDIPSSISIAARARGLPVLVWTCRAEDDHARVAAHADAPIYEQAA